MQTAMIWGASGGIGRALAETLRANDWTVLAVCRQPEHIRDVTPLAFAADVARPHSIEQAAYAAGMEADAVNLWIYAIGDIASTRAARLDPDEWERLRVANLDGAYLAWLHSQPLLAPDAHLVFLGAITERLVLPGLSAYVAAKAGLAAFTEVLAKEHRRGRVTLVRPSAVATPFWEKVPFKLPADAFSPGDVAARIVAAHDEGHAGTLDLTP